MIMIINITVTNHTYLCTNQIVGKNFRIVAQRWTSLPLSRSPHHIYHCHSNFQQTTCHTEIARERSKWSGYPSFRIAYFGRCQFLCIEMRSELNGVRYNPLPRSYRLLLRSLKLGNESCRGDVEYKWGWMRRGMGASSSSIFVKMTQDDLRRGACPMTI